MEIVRNDHAHGRRAGDHIVDEIAEKQRVDIVVSVTVESAKRQNKRINDHSDVHGVITRLRQTFVTREEMIEAIDQHTACISVRDIPEIIANYFMITRRLYRRKDKSTVNRLLMSD
ncbi:TPA: hypothetical protein N2Y43_004878, partial [Escherichia coli]|nr:hypothetical protein [Escherichia coli]HCL7751454.1 hypothetical protein [Escherichia coli]HCX5793869.1 hypothetical protein [Escherichia coli]HDY1357039.1 hypothetical protein [Escherichia coli]